MSIADGDDFDDAAFESKLTTALSTEGTTEAEANQDPEPEAPTDVDKADEEPEAAAPDPPDAPILGKFKSVDDLVASYQQLEQKLGQTAEERRELNELRDQMSQLTQAVQTSPQAGFDWDTQIEENPKVALEQAASTRNEAVYERVKAQVNEYHPGLADVWEDAQWAKYEIGKLREETTARYQPVADSVQKDVEVREYQEAWATIAQKYPDARDLVAAIQAEGESNPGLSTADKQAYFDNLYWLAKAKQAGTHDAAVQQVQDEQKANADALKRAATVTSASSTGDHKPQSAVDVWREDFRKFLFEEPTSIRAGLTTD